MIKTEPAGNPPVPPGRRRILEILKKGGVEPTSFWKPGLAPARNDWYYEVRVAAKTKTSRAHHRYVWVPAWAYSVLHKMAHEHGDVPLDRSDRWSKTFWKETVELLKTCSTSPISLKAYLAVTALYPTGTSWNLDNAIWYARLALRGQDAGS